MHSLSLRVLVALVVALAALGGVDPPRHADGRWAWPVPAPHAIARPFIAPDGPYGPGHRGVDLRAPAGTQVRAPAAGVVHFAGFVVDRPVVSLRHAGGVLSSFEPVDAVVAEGERVRRGQVIGILVAGHCSSPCLHLGARVDGVYVNPLRFLGGVPSAVLLPVRRS
jgi:murein DD-endopeptidase MepM/ murein hydrolase activator NlpD